MNVARTPRTLADLPIGTTATVASVAESGPLGARLRALGFVPGSEVRVRRMAPFRDPIEFIVRGTYISLRRTEARLVILQTV